MITKITGVVNRVLDEEVRLQVGPYEHQVLVPEFVRRIVQTQIGSELSLHISEYLEGNPVHGRMVPRMIGFLSEGELDFFDLFCTVDKVGIRKAMKALIRPVKDIADAIQRQDHRWLSTLPGVGQATAEKIVATLRKKVTKYALMPTRTADATGVPATPVNVSSQVLEDAYQALLSVGHNPAEARDLLDKILADGKTYASAEEVLIAIYASK